MSATRKSLYTLLIVLIAAVAATGVADDVSNEYAEDALKRALATFAVARTLNGIISVAQGTEIALEPGGVGVMLTPGQILDPINDLVERFSSVMLVAASSLGLQIVLLEILSWWVLTAALVATLVTALLVIWSPGLRNNRVVAAIPKVAAALVVVRFALPVIIICTNFVFETFLETRHDTASSELSASATQIERISADIDAADQNSAAADAEDGAFELPSWDDVRESAAQLYSSTTDWIRSNSVSERIAGLQESASSATSHIIDLIVIFVLQTIVFPVVFLWLFVETLKALASRSMNVVRKPIEPTPPAQ
ncbi:MAG: hypothetical protein QNI96_01275 [Woeseiaceae bacterium]|nr:hypothetical protein [Woeseiaceae bacterium]